MLGALFRKVQGGSCQNSIGSPKFFEDREVICFYDRNQLTGEMRLSPISVEVSTGSDHRWQLTCAVRYRQRFVHPWQPHRRERLNLRFGQLHLVVDVGRIAQWGQLEDAGDSKSRRHLRMVQ